MYCERCGVPNPDGSQFCGACGNQLATTAGFASTDHGYGGAGTYEDLDPWPAPGSGGYPREADDPYDGYDPEGYDAYPSEEEAYPDDFDGYEPALDPFFEEEDPYRDQYLSQQRYIAEHGIGLSGSLGSGSIGPEPGEVEGPLKERRSLALYVVLSVLTLGIYGCWCVHGMARDANVLCARDGERTPGAGPYVLLTLCTLGIYPLYWMYKIAERLRRNAPAYDVRIEQGGLVVLLWDTLGVLVVVGPFIAMHHVLRGLDRLSRVYNERYVFH